ncbi:LOW QUALITY PROTEIN: protein mono-ADP-ribosyltransferase PARP9 [Cottoperca gobio]|uniref:LOW QUALITY PROTEIN: protein mono-ADP-ribosyltransferase PARP9 n=1 Tax=Cottoperca gobio TaxID=56716 RepID=A0A6J2RV91_COTGO|nr:LOW QUALITY PROTEIN: protein mono-ADP-ribosyltransferase PARP9 [Cottoperca gobio]
MASKLEIRLHESSLNIVKQCGSALGDVLQSKFGCVATFHGVEFERDPSIAQQRGPTVKPEKRFAVTLHGGVQLSVWKADLIDFQADAVVNAANKDLQHYGGLARALSKAGGPQIQKDSDDYISSYGPLNTGDAVVCDPGCLPCKKIIHAVGPCLSKNPSPSEVSRAKPQLEMAIKSILRNAEKHRLQSVAIPAISSGLFNFPLPECANTIVETVKRYYLYSQPDLPKEIFLVNNDTPTVNEMERAVSQIFATGKSRGEGRTSTPAVQMGNVHLTLKWGKIEEQQTDVIVNTASAQRDLNIGQISKALLQRAGHEMQQEMRKASSAGLVVITKPYKLKCKQVYHTFCPEKWSKPQHQRTAEETLSSSVSECLWLAVRNNHKSISFPAIGTGALGFDKKEVASIMTNAVADFANKTREKMDVCFVIFHADDATYKAFEEQMVQRREKGPDPDFKNASEYRDDFHGSRAPTPQISLDGPSDESTHEAKRWLNDLFLKSDGTVNICNNFIQLFGEQEHRQLSRLMKKEVSIKEVFEKGRAGITVNGRSFVDVVVAGLQVEAMLCNIQREFVMEEESYLLNALCKKNMSFQRKTVDTRSGEFMERSFAFNKTGLQILRVEKVENPILDLIFTLKGNQLGCSTPRRMFQSISAQFCEMVSHIGFHAQYAPPDETAFGEGIYFAGTVKKAKEVWREQKEEYLYFVEAEVLTGNSTPGRPGLILPPADGADSVSGGPDVSVIFSGYQALPTFIITCKKV